MYIHTYTYIHIYIYTYVLDAPGAHAFLAPLFVVIPPEPWNWPHNPNKALNPRFETSAEECEGGQTYVRIESEIPLALPRWGHRVNREL